MAKKGPAEGKPPASENMAQGEKAPPIAKVRIGSSVVNVWENHNAQGATWHSFTLERIYKPEGDNTEWQSTTSFNRSDLPDLIAALEQIYKQALGMETETVGEMGERVKSILSLQGRKSQRVQVQSQQG